MAVHLHQANFHSRHYSYECKAKPEERPYRARPSRTAQLKNPKLAPKLNSDVPNDLLRKKGTADEILASKATERGRKRSRSVESGKGKSRRGASRSMSTSSKTALLGREGSGRRQLHDIAKLPRSTSKTPKTIHQLLDKLFICVPSQRPQYTAAAQVKITRCTRKKTKQIQR
ncbi:hypothetical protein EG328_004868 [Venturia inaequalis]|uniref:Uncharacterized protein n=1 Tax=Venturia inaequalis TaxID=5025 RepID=A0A8H3VJR7_VENIN|nr:hypothetical protein EG328_004868 [Venturia inaequalis]KAE9989671.1 hypothetical protein EG327_002392 [Venturia inaequalis]